MQESLKLHCQDEENAGSGRHGQADIFFLHRNGDESTPEVSLQYPLLHFVAFFHVASLFLYRVDNRKVGVDNKKALELTNSTVFHRGRQ